MSLFNIHTLVARQHCLVKSIGLLLLLLVHSPCQANDNTLLTNADAPPLGIGVALDSEGKPIAMPTTGSALEYRSPQNHSSKKTNSKKSNPSQRTKKKSANTQSRKQKLTSRANVANDPSCRWLDKRMDKLERSLAYAGNQTSYGFHRDELTIRRQEWLCMKCGAQGPNQRDRQSCQYRR
ncbi:hypothetical protein [Shewanella sp.]|uniref:hypothetical protein n=1 Tax=Shewanella sp. TaxID=50422 RepID=UPI001EC80549|nr:hypothetical protein [Shewanella sp.]NRB22319.1 hypothetical protein [Shewanella sp.]